MAIIYLENSQCRAEFSLHGAELTSFKNCRTGDEYLWQADPAIWNRSAPFLFPNVGRLKDNTYFYQNKKYYLGQHGFLRDVEFSLEQETPDEVVLSFVSSQVTLENYPFHFRATVTYRLSENHLSVCFKLENTDQQTIYFSYGNHAGFAAPINPDLTFEDYYLVIKPEECRERIVLTAEKQSDLLHTTKEESAPIHLDHELFKHDALIYKTVGKTEITLKSDKDPAKLVVSYENFSYVGIWSPYPKCGNFICIQPWCGIADRVGTDQQWENKTGIQALAVGESFERTFQLSIY